MCHPCFLLVICPVMVGHKQNREKEKKKGTREVNDLDFMSREKAFSLQKYNLSGKLFLTLPVNTLYIICP